MLVPLALGYLTARTAACIDFMKWVFRKARDRLNPCQPGASQHLFNLIHVAQRPKIEPFLILQDKARDIIRDFVKQRPRAHLTYPIADSRC